MQLTEREEHQNVEGDPEVTPAYDEPEAISLGMVTKLTRNANSGPFTDGNSDNTFRWKSG